MWNPYRRWQRSDPLEHPITCACAPCMAELRRAGGRRGCDPHQVQLDLSWLSNMESDESAYFWERDHADDESCDD